MARRRKNLTKKLNELVIRVNEHHECLQDLIEHLMENEKKELTVKDINTELLKDVLAKGITIGMDLKPRIWKDRMYA